MFRDFGNRLLFIENLDLELVNQVSRILSCFSRILFWNFTIFFPLYGLFIF